MGSGRVISLTHFNVSYLYIQVHAFKCFSHLYVLADINISMLQSMRLIINDKRYGALKTLVERKQAFNEVILISLERTLIAFLFVLYSLIYFFLLSSCCFSLHILSCKERVSIVCSICKVFEWVQSAFIFVYQVYR